MKKLLALLATMLLATLAFAVPAGAQEQVVGTVTPDPATVPEAGDYEFTAVGAGFIPDSAIILTSCISPLDLLVPGVSTVEEITAGLQAAAADPLTNCDVAGAVPITVDSDGGWTGTVSATVGDNFLLSAGALDGSQGGLTWIPIVDAETAAAIAEAQELAVTGVDTFDYALIGLVLMLAGAAAVLASRKLSPA